MKRRVWTLAAAVTTALVLMLPVSADLIWTPANSFFEAHHQECSYVARMYEVGGYEGYTSVFDEPDGTSVGTVENGKRVHIQFCWPGEKAWGYVNAGAAEGWVPMDDLSLIYDSQQFMEDHASEIRTGDPVPVEFREAMLYEYPNGPSRLLMEEVEDYEPFSETFSAIFTDEQGKDWGYIGYYMGRVDAWVCLDDPMNEELSTAVVETPPSAAQLSQTPSVEEGGNPLLLPGVLVAGVVAVTAVLMGKLCPKKKS